MRSLTHLCTPVIMEYPPQDLAWVNREIFSLKREDLIPIIKENIKRRN